MLTLKCTNAFKRIKGNKFLYVCSHLADDQSIYLQSNSPIFGTISSVKRHQDIGLWLLNTLCSISGSI